MTDSKKKTFLFLIPIIFIFNSCVYYNTFYNAEVSFLKANKIIDESPLILQDEIPPQAKKLLDDVVKNALIVIEKYPDSKYIDDAYFILARATFLKQEYAKSEKYIRLLLENEPNSIFVLEANIWLSYIFLKINNLDECDLVLSSLESLNHTNKSLFLINKIKAELNIERNNIEMAYESYAKALTFTEDKSTKTSILNKLFLVAEKQKDLDRIIMYLTELEIYAPIEMKKDVMLDWIRYNRKAGNFNSILTKIDMMLTSSEYQSIYMKLELERAKVYLDKQDFQSAKLFFSDFTQLYQRKNETAEAYYHLGYISLMEDFNLDLAKEYFEKSKKERSSSDYGKMSREMLLVIDDFEALEYEYDISIGNTSAEKVIIEDEKKIADNQKIIQNIPEPMQQSKSSPDSLLFTIAEKLLFDFGKTELALDKFALLVDDYKASRYHMQSMYILSKYLPNSKWSKEMISFYPNINFDEVLFDNSIDEQKEKRNQLWAKLSDSSFNSEDLAKSLNKMFYEDSDTLALYEYAFVQDYYLDNIKLALEAYNQFLKYELPYAESTSAKNRVVELEELLIMEKQRLMQKISYNKAINLLNNDFSIDSVIILLDSTLIGENSKYKKSAQKMKNRINILSSYLEDITPADDSIAYTKDIDSLYYLIGDIYHLDFRLGLKAAPFYKKIIENKFDKYRYNTLVTLSQIDSQYVDILYSEYPDSIYAVDSTRINFIPLDEIYESDFLTYTNFQLKNLEEYLMYFPKDTAIDTSKESLINTIDVRADSTKIITSKKVN